MKAKLFEVYWHEKQPIFSLCKDFQYRFASSGADGCIRIWTFSETHQPVHLSSLQKHSKAVNAIAFHPSENTLASAGDGAMLILWSLADVQAKTATTTSPLFAEEDKDDASEPNKENWNPITITRIIDSEDIYDLKWSICGNLLFLALTNNSVVVWCYKTGKILKTIRDHGHFVQGISVDPLGALFASQSSDRSVRVYLFKNDKSFISKCIQILSKVPVLVSGELKPQIYRRLFHDETLVSFFRRLSFSPDGSLLAVPCGAISDFAIATQQHFNGTCRISQSFLYLYTRASLVSVFQAYPAIILGPFEKAPVVVRFHPSFFKVNPELKSPLSLHYAMVFAIATQDSVIVYRTDSESPLAILTGMHFSTITDLCWVVNAHTGNDLLVISSTDGFCSAIIFETNELGEVISKVDPMKLYEQSRLPKISASDVISVISELVSPLSLEDAVRDLVSTAN